MKSLTKIFGAVALAGAMSLAGAGFAADANTNAPAAAVTVQADQPQAVKDQAQASTIETVTLADINAEVFKADGPVLLDIYADWCTPCKLLEPELEELARSKGSDLKIVRLDIDQFQKDMQDLVQSRVNALLKANPGLATDEKAFEQAVNKELVKIFEENPIIPLVLQNVKGIPAMLLFDEGKPLAMISGFQDADVLKEFVDKVLEQQDNKPAPQQPSPYKPSLSF